MSNKPKTELLILGVYPESDGYPNTKYRIAELETSPDLRVTKIHATIWKHNISGTHKISRLSTLVRFGYAHLVVFYRYLRHTPKTIVYIPYPSVFISYLLSWLPQGLRPTRILLDAFISLYDTIICDRQLLTANHFLAKCLYAIERRAYLASHKIIVDTPQNADYFAKLFQLPPSLIQAIPLTTYEAPELYKAYQLPRNNQWQVVFVGTLIPLHGIEIILKTIAKLAEHPNIHFKIIGTGQLANSIKDFRQTHAVKFTWIDSWLSQETMLKEVLTADICLGIFGSTAKTQRVLPLKLFSYAFCGRAIISADTDCMRSINADQAMALIPAGSSKALSATILNLIAHPQQINHLASASKAFYQQRLTNRQALSSLLELMQL